MHPERGDGADIEAVLTRVHQREAFGVRLHEAVLDPVMNHLHVVAGSVPANPQIAALGREREEDRLEIHAHVLLAPDHQAVAFLEAPYASARTGIDVVEIPGAE